MTLNKETKPNQTYRGTIVNLFKPLLGDKFVHIFLKGINPKENTII